MRGEEIRQGIDIFPALSEEEKRKKENEGNEVQSLGKSKKAATLAVGETAISRVLNSTPIMVLPPLVLVRLQKTEWLKARPRMVLPVNLGKLEYMRPMNLQGSLLMKARTDPHNFDICAAVGSRSFPSETGN